MQNDEMIVLEDFLGSDAVEHPVPEEPGEGLTSLISWFDDQAMWGFPYFIVVFVALVAIIVGAVKLVEYWIEGERRRNYAVSVASAMAVAVAIGTTSVLAMVHYSQQESKVSDHIDTAIEQQLTQRYDVAEFQLVSQSGMFNFSYHRSDEYTPMIDPQSFRPAQVQIIDGQGSVGVYGLRIVEDQVRLIDIASSNTTRSAEDLLLEDTDAEVSS